MGEDDDDADGATAAGGVAAPLVAIPMSRGDRYNCFYVLISKFAIKDIKPARCFAARAVCARFLARRLAAASCQLAAPAFCQALARDIIGARVVFGPH